jgi:hypothetical protein
MKKHTVLVVSLLAILVLATVAVFPSRAVQAVVATLIRDQDAPGRHPFAATCSATNTTLGNDANCSIPVPPGEEVIVQSVTLAGNSQASNTLMGFAVAATTAGSVTVPFQSVIHDSGLAQPSSSTFLATQLSWFPADPGSKLICDGGTADQEVAGQINFRCTVLGYSVTLP